MVQIDAGLLAEIERRENAAEITRLVEKIARCARP